MTALHPIAIRILSVPGWRLRVWLLVIITVTLAGLPLPIAGLVLWIVGLLGMTLMETIAVMIREQHQAQRRLEVDRDLREQAVLLAKRDAQIAALKADLVRAHSASNVRSETPEQCLHRKVGLHPGAPDFLLIAARRAYRMALHPDRHARHARQAHKRYLQAEAVFDEIERMRS